MPEDGDGTLCRAERRVGERQSLPRFGAIAAVGSGETQQGEGVGRASLTSYNGSRKLQNSQDLTGTVSNGL